MFSRVGSFLSLKVLPPQPSPDEDDEAPLHISQPEEVPDSPGDSYNPLTSLDAFKV